MNNSFTPAFAAAAASGNLSDMLTASTPGGIKQQEARGQAEFCLAAQLPRRFQNVTQSQLESVGFKFGDVVDELFVSATLPPGWTKRATDHNMWSELLDHEGRVRASIFFKAAFYDRDAFMNVNRRFIVSTHKPGETTDSRQCLVEDRMTGETHFFGEFSKKAPYKVTEEVQAQAEAWLNANYPDWASPLAYWGALTLDEAV